MLKELLRVLGGKGSGNFGHGGRPGQRGGSARTSMDVPEHSQIVLQLKNAVSQARMLRNRFQEVLDARGEELNALLEASSIAGHKGPAAEALEEFRAKYFYPVQRQEMGEMGYLTDADGLSKDDVSAVLSYYRDDKDPATVASALNKAIEALPRTTSAMSSWRGVRIPMEHITLLQEAVSKEGVAVLTNRGVPSSWTDNESVAWGFASSAASTRATGHRSHIKGEGLLLNVLMPSGTRAGRVDSGWNMGSEHVLHSDYNVAITEIRKFRDGWRATGIIVDAKGIRTNAEALAEIDIFSGHRQRNANNNEGSPKTLGSATSGNFGHAGRPGQRGGSSKRGAPEAVTTVSGRALSGEETGVPGEVVRKIFQTTLEGTPAKAAADLKRQVMGRLAKRLLPQYQKMRPLIKQMFAKTLSITEVDASPALKESTTQAVVSTLVNNWAGTSSDHDALALGIQKAAADEFGLKCPAFDEYMKTAVDSGRVGSIDRMMSPEIQTAVRTFLRAQYEDTQQRLKAEGIEELTVFRGYRGPREKLEAMVGDNTVVMQNPLSSWSVDPNTATAFGESGVLMAATFKREDVMGMPGHGFGCADEEEFVIRGGLFKVSCVFTTEHDSVRYLQSPEEKGHTRQRRSILAIKEALSRRSERLSIPENPVEATDAATQEAQKVVDAVFKTNEATPIYLDDEENADWIDRSKDVIVEVDIEAVAQKEPKSKKVRVNELLPVDLPMALVVMRAVRANGGATSGNFGHAGRPGQRGGSAKRGGPIETPVAKEPEVAPVKSPREQWSERVASAYETWSKARQAKLEWDAEGKRLWKAYQAAGGKYDSPEDKAHSAHTDWQSPQYRRVHDELEEAGKKLQATMADGPEDVPYSKNNPNQTEMFTTDTRFDPLAVVDIKKNMLDLWTLSGDNQVILQDIADDVYGRDVRSDWEAIVRRGVENVPITEDEYSWAKWPNDTPRPVERALDYVRGRIHEKDASVPQEVLDAVARHKAMRKEHPSYSDPQYSAKLEALEAERARVASTIHTYMRDAAVAIGRDRVLQEMNRTFENQADPSTLGREGLKRAFMSMKAEAFETAPKDGLLVHRGVTLSKAEKALIKKEIEEKGFYEMPVPPVQSYTRQESLAVQFAKYGQTGGKQKSRDFVPSGIVITSKVPREDLWMHDRQPTWTSFMKEAVAKGLKFHIGGTDQKEVLVGHPQPTLRLTKENVKWI